ncbi:FAD-dependent oxidoreductase [Chitinophagaceae bacterium MMS25-I14]
MLRVYSCSDSSEAYEIRDFLSRNGVDFEQVTIDDDNELIAAGIMPWQETPVVEIHDGRRLFAPTLPQIAGNLGLVTTIGEGEYDVAIYGAGPAGLSAAVYAASEGLKTVLLEKIAIGGQAGTSSLIENYMGFPEGIRGSELAERARQQAVKFGADIVLFREGVRGEFCEDRFCTYLADGTRIISKASICATGIDYQRLELENEQTFLNHGLFYGAGTSEAAMCMDEHVFVVGGGNSAGQAALNFSKYARKVTMLVRGKSLSESLSQYLINRIAERKNIEILYESQITALNGDLRLREITVRAAGEQRVFNTSRVFVCIGGKPNTHWVTDAGIMCRGDYLLTGPDIIINGQLPASWTKDRMPYFLETSLPGAFAAGDVRFGSVKRVAAAVGEGAMAVTFIHKYLSEL